MMMGLSIMQKIYTTKSKQKFKTLKKSCITPNQDAKSEKTVNLLTACLLDKYLAGIVELYYI